MFGIFKRSASTLTASPYSNASVTDSHRVLVEMRKSSIPHILLDVRNPSEFVEGYIEGAINIPVSNLSGRIAEISAHKANAVIVYCRSGGRSSMAAQILAANGFSQVTNVAGGFLDWASKSLPIAKRNR